MIFTVIGMLAFTAFLLYCTLTWLAGMLISDESFFFGLKNYPIIWLIWVVGGATLNVVGWYLWWILLGSRISIGFN